MKKVLTILGAAITCSTLFACNPDNKVTGITISGFPFALSEKWYQLDLNATGKGSFSKTVSWTTDDPHAYVTSDGKFEYMSNLVTEPIDVKVTATSVQDPSIKADFTIKVLATAITDDYFLEYAEKGDTYLYNAYAKQTELSAKHVFDTKIGESDFAYDPIKKEKGVKVKIVDDAYKLNPDSTTEPKSVTASIGLKYGSSSTYPTCPTKDLLKDRLEKYKSSGTSYSCFESNNEDGLTYGTVVYNVDSSGTYKTTVTIYQLGVAINYWYYSGTELLDYINLNVTFLEF